MPRLVSPAVEELTAAVDAHFGDDSLITSEERLLGDVEATVEARNKLDALLVRRLRAAHHLEASVRVTGRPTRDWLTVEQLLAGPLAGKLMVLVRHLPAYPLAAAAFDAGRISADHAAAVVRALRSLPVELRETVEPFLVDAALEDPPETVVGMVDDLLERLGLDKESEVRRERALGERSFKVMETLGRGGAVTGWLTAEVREKVMTVMRAVAQKAGPEDTRSGSQRWHDALGEVFDFYLAHSDDMPAVNGERPRVVAHLPLELILERTATVRALLDSGAEICPETARRMACDCEVIPLVLGSKSEVLDIGRVSREPTAAQRRACWVRDRGRCAFDGCTRPPRELHHIVWWSYGGRTSIDNLAWLCAFHHWLVHEGKWSMRREADGGCTFTGPEGGERHRHSQAA